MGARLQGPARLGWYLYLCERDGHAFSGCNATAQEAPMIDPKRRFPFEIDHIDGDYSPAGWRADNVVLLCTSCNRAKNNRERHLNGESRRQFIDHSRRQFMENRLSRLGGVVHVNGHRPTDRNIISLHQRTPLGARMMKASVDYDSGTPQMAVNVRAHIPGIDLVIGWVSQGVKWTKGEMARVAGRRVGVSTKTMLSYIDQLTAPTGPLVEATDNQGDTVLRAHEPYFTEELAVIAEVMELEATYSDEERFQAQCPPHVRGIRVKTPLASTNGHHATNGLPP